MTTKKQDKLDEIKWYLGNELGFDPCGTFEYCKFCNKDEQNPCEKAIEKYKNAKNGKVKKQQSKQKIGKSNFRATVVDNNQ